jgi:dTDP-4-dehydrorhamnose reductase
MDNQKPTILVTGASGQLGSEIKVVSKNYTEEYNFIFTNKTDLPIDDFIALENFFEANQIDYCINCAAYTAVDKAETETELAYAINERGAANLAKICTTHNTALIHISTDYVFNGSATTPIEEGQKTSPTSVYGFSKLKGEQAVIAQCQRAIIIRTSWVYSNFGSNFVKTMQRLMAERTSINVVNDQLGLPTYAKDLAIALLTIVDNWEENLCGLYHFCNTGQPISWYNFASAIKDFTNSPCEINAITTADYPTPAKRPAYSVLSTNKISTAFGINIPNWQDSLARCLKAQ